MSIYIWAVIAVVIIIILLLTLGTFMFFNMAIKRVRGEKGTKSCWDKDTVFNESSLSSVELLPYYKNIAESVKWIKAQDTVDYSVTSFDGLLLKAKLVKCENMRGIVLMMHGFHSDPIHDFSGAVKCMTDRGLACFMPFQRAHGESEGRYLYYGTREKYDVLMWCRLIEKEFPGIPVILDGVSMGASTVLMASGIELPGNVKGIIADCGFTSPAEIFESVMKNSFKISKFPFFHTTRILSRLTAGFDFYDDSTLEALTKNRLPVLFAHGEADSFVPHYMSERAFEVAEKYCDATFLSVPGAGHGMSYIIAKERYIAELDKLIDKCIK